MSLRARLIIGLVALAAAGLLIAGGVTYAEQRSFLYERVDEQLQAAGPVVSAALDEKLDRHPARPAGQALPTGGIGPTPGGGDPPDRRGDGPRRDRPGVDLELRTYGELRAADGRRGR